MLNEAKRSDVSAKRYKSISCQLPGVFQEIDFYRSGALKSRFNITETDPDFQEVCHARFPVLICRTRKQTKTTFSLVRPMTAYSLPKLPVVAWILLLIPLFCVASAFPAQALELTDSDGKRIVYEKPFSRIISLYPAHTENLIALDCADRIVAVGSGDPFKGKRPSLRFQDDPERLLALKPDLVLIRPMISRGYPNLVQILERNGVTVVSLQPARHTDLPEYWRNLGELCGAADRAQKLLADFQQGVAALEAETRKTPVEKRPRVYFESIHRQMKTFNPDAIAIFALETAGGINVAADAQQVRNTNIAAYGKERILAKAGEIDVFLAQKGRMNPVSVEEIRTEPGFETIRAVQTGRVYLVDEKLVSRPTPALLEGMKTLRRLLYPEETAQ